MLNLTFSNPITIRRKSIVEVEDLTSELTLSGLSPSRASSNVRLSPPDGEFSCGNESDRSICASHGSISVVGRRRMMEDTMTVVTAPASPAKAAEGEISRSYDFFAVYDGHGGARVSGLCRDRMHVLLANEVDGRTRSGCWETVMRSCFEKMDKELVLGGGDEDGGEWVAAVVVLVTKELIVVASCGGDSRALLCGSGGVGVRLSSDPKHDRSDEMDRVKADGGRVVNGNGSQVPGAHAASRAIGNQNLQPYVTSEPEVTITEREDSSDHFIIVASDGLWDVMPNDLACEVVRRCLIGKVSKRLCEEVSNSSSMEAATMLAELAMARGSGDNITIIVVELNKFSEVTS